MQSVTSLNNQIKSLLETTFLHVSVNGEISRLTYHSSGHVYFTLKDERSSLSCVLFRGNAAKLKFRLEEGMAVVVHGGVSVYTPRGSYQINCVSIEPEGAGALSLAYEQLKKRLQQKGYFEYKKPLPQKVAHVILITSATGAALQDMLRVAQKRWPLVRLSLIDTIVQGESASGMIARNIQRADKLGADVIVIGRGGGSIEDLWAFNEEIVADAIFAAQTFILSAVGHEIDYVISDFVADMRAATPSAAMEMILPDRAEVLLRLDDMMDQMSSVIRHTLHNKQERLEYLKKLFSTHSFEAKIAMSQRELALILNRLQEYMLRFFEAKIVQIATMKNDMDFMMQKILHTKENAHASLLGALCANDPAKGIKESYAQVVKDGKKSSLKALKLHDIFELHSQDEIVKANVIAKGVHNAK